MISSALTDINTLADRLAEAGRIVVTTHMRPDGDAMGCSLAMFQFIRKYFKADVRIVLNDRYPDSLSFMVSPESGSSILVYQEAKDKALDAISQADLIISLDFNGFHRTDGLEEALSSATAYKVLIDHHLNPDTRAFDLIFSRQDVSSASELLFHILKSMPECKGQASALPMEAAEALMTGMTTDSNNFSNSTYPSTLAMAAELMDMGVDRGKILFELYNRYGENRLRLLGHMLKDLMVITPDGVAYMILDKATLSRYRIEEGETEGFVNYPLSIGKVRMSILLKEDEDRIRVSIRSKEGTSANKCSRLHFNGGGHENAAGGRLMIPEDLSDISQAAEYIEKHTHIFITQENEA